MSIPINNDALDTVFRQARTHNVWLDQTVGDDVLSELYDLMKWGPTSANSSPARILFLRTPEAKQRLRPALSPTNVDKTMQAPVTAILGYDLQFFEELPKLFPNNPAARGWFANAPQFAETSAFRNASLQGGYFILAARSLGLDCGAHVRLRQCQGGRRILQQFGRKPACISPSQVEFLVQSRLWRCFQAIPAQSSLGV